jgi:DNA-binding SARP family transcriptional activator
MGMPTAVVRVQVLGVLNVEVDGVAVSLGGPRQRAVLAILLCGRPSGVSIDKLVDGLWGDDAPPSAMRTLRAYVSRLRRLLEPKRARDEPATVLVTSAAGYQVRLPGDAVDAGRYEHLLREARRTGPSDPARARSIAFDALKLWRGPAYAEVADRPWAVVEAARLEELRLAGWELLIELTLRAGAPADAVSWALALTGRHPLREEGWRLLAMSLWATGRQVEALDALRRSRSILVDEAGLDPGPALVELEHAILTQRVEILRQSTGARYASTLLAQPILPPVSFPC